MKEHNIAVAEFFVDENAPRVFNCDESGFPLAGTSGKLKVITICYVAYARVSRGKRKNE